MDATLPPGISQALSDATQEELQELPDPHVPPEPTHLAMPEGIRGSLERKARRGRAESLKEGEEDVERESIGVEPPTPYVLSEVGEPVPDPISDPTPDLMRSDVAIDEEPMEAPHVQDGDVDRIEDVDEDPEQPRLPTHIADVEGSDDEDDPFKHMGNDSMTMPGAVDLDDEDGAGTDSGSEGENSPSDASVGLVNRDSVDEEEGRLDGEQNMLSELNSTESSPPIDKTASVPQLVLEVDSGATIPLPDAW